MAAMAVLNSCSHPYYIPNAHNVPLFKDKDELHLGASIGATDRTIIAELQTAYSITNSLAVMGNGYYAEGGNKDLSNWGRGWYMEGALGYYVPFGNKFIFEVYGGYGMNNQQHRYIKNDVPSPYLTTLSYSKFFIQPNIGLSLPFLDVAFSTKLGQVMFSNINDPNQIEALSQTGIRRASLAIEPAITLRTGWKSFQLQLQASASKMLGYDDSYYFDLININVGLRYTLGRKYESTTKLPSE